MKYRSAFKFLGIPEDSSAKVINQTIAAKRKDIVKATLLPDVDSEQQIKLKHQLSQLETVVELFNEKESTAKSQVSGDVIGDLSAISKLTTADVKPKPKNNDLLDSLSSLKNLTTKTNQTPTQDESNSDLLGDLSGLKNITREKTPTKNKPEADDPSPKTSSMLDDLSSLANLTSNTPKETEPEPKQTTQVSSNQMLLDELKINSQTSKAESIEKIDQQKQTLTKSMERAPTAALKQKYQAKITELDTLKKTFLDKPDSETATKPSNKPKFSNTAPPSSPLSHTKMADLPQAGAQFGEQQLSLEPGTILSDRYEVIEQIGAGGMGAVFIAYDKNREQNIAIKVLLPSLLQSPSAKERFMDEARLSSQLSHPNIVNVYDVQNDGEFYFLTMELLEGQNLREYMENLELTRQTIEVEDVVNIAKEICDGLNHAHEITVHRDIKPENIWIGGDGKVKLMDFGIARVMSSSQMTKTGAAMGTAYYMSPEQLKGRMDIDGRADQYALGVMLYELLSGQIPAGRVESVHKVRKDVSKKLSLTIDKMLSGNPDQRFENILEVKAALSGKGSRSMPSMPSFSFVNKGGAIAAIFLIASTIGAAGYTGHLEQLWEAIRPYSEEEVIAFKAEAANAEAKVVTMGKRLDDVLRDLRDDRRDFKSTASRIESNMSRESSSQRRVSAQKLKQTEYQMDLLEAQERLLKDHIIDGSRRGELNGKMNLAKDLLKEKSYEKAMEAYREGLSGYENLKIQAVASKELAEYRYASNREKKIWKSTAPKYNINSIPFVDKVVLEHDKAEDLIAVANFADAAPILNEVWQNYQQATAAITHGSDFKKKSTRAKSSWENYARKKSVTTKYTAQFAGQFKLAEQQWSAGDIVPASKTYKSLFTNYTELENAAANASKLKTRVASRKTEWDRYRKSNNMTIGLTSKYANQYSAANKNFQAGQIVDAAKVFSDLNKNYSSLLSSAKNVNSKLYSVNQSRRTWNNHVNRSWGKRSRSSAADKQYNNAKKLIKSGSWTDAATQFSSAKTKYDGLNSSATKNRNNYEKKLKEWEREVSSLSKKVRSLKSDVSDYSSDISKYRRRSDKRCSYDSSWGDAFSSAACELGCDKQVFNGTYYETRRDQYCVSSCRNKANSKARKKERAYEKCKSGVSSAYKSMKRAKDRHSSAKSKLRTAERSLSSKRNNKPRFYAY